MKRYLLLCRKEENICTEEFRNMYLNKFSNVLKYEPPFDLKNENFSGPHNFEVSIFSSPSHTRCRYQWNYSESLQKIFVTMDTAFPVDFKWNNFNNKCLFVRATVVFNEAQHTQKLVVRCVQHSQPTEQNNLYHNASIISHVIRCHNIKAKYDGDIASEQPLSVRVPLGMPQPGVDYVRQMYTFVCKNSCPGIGINRKPIDVVFTLEDENSRILGRKVFGVRVCSCPKRDKIKEERKVAITKANSQCNKDVIDLNLKIVGKSNAYSVLKYAYDLLAGEAARTGEDNQFNGIMQTISNEMENYK